VIVILLLSILNCFSQNKVDLVFAPISGEFTKITGGILLNRTQKNIQNLYKKIDVESLKEVFRHERERWYAEPEFVGHYLEAGIHIYETTGDVEILDNVRSIIDVIIESQPESGYLGTYKKGEEFDPTFSVWNQNFVIKGLLAYYEKTGYDPALDAAIKCGDFLANSYLHNDAPDIFYAVNNGIENVTVLDEIAHLYRLTRKQLYLDFANYILKRLEDSPTKIITMPNTLPHWMIIYTIGCKKGIEMFVLYRGLIDLYKSTGRDEYFSAIKNYWTGIAKNDIRITGNGTINEMWTYLRNKPLKLTNDLKPNENCVAMGWMQMCAMMFEFEADGEYFDAFEKTLYNHLIGSQALDGHDFSYYQGNIGAKIHATHPGMYSCCRYRGMRILAHLPRFIYMQGDQCIAVNLYADSETNVLISGVPLKIKQQTRYPRNGNIKVMVNPKKNVEFTLLLRKPGWCQKAKVTVNGKTVDVTEREGYLYLTREWAENGDVVELDLEMQVKLTRTHIIDREPSKAVMFGPIVLAIDSRYGTPIESTQLDTTSTFALVSLPDDIWNPQIKVEGKGKVNGKKQKITLVDYATAGSIDPGKDLFRLWIPVAQD
jgi:DUF1680 family protein